MGWRAGAAAWPFMALRSHSPSWAGDAGEPRVSSTVTVLKSDKSDGPSAARQQGQTFLCQVCVSAAGLLEMETWPDPSPYLPAPTVAHAPWTSLCLSAG